MRSLIASLSALLLFLILLPIGINSYYTDLLTKILILGIFAMSLDLLVGYLDLPSLGHAAFFGAAAYTIGIISARGQENFLLIFLLGILMAGSFGALFGLLALRTRGAYFLMITLALSQVLWGIAFSWRSFTGGDDGISGISRPNIHSAPWSFQQPTVFFYFVLVIFICCVISAYVLILSPFGRIILGIKESEERMLALGYNTWLYKYICFIIAALYAGISGCLQAFFIGFVSPACLNVTTSAEALLMVILGGAGTLFGPILGSAAIVLLENLISAYTERWLLVLGIIYVIITMFAPNGILGPIRKFTARRARKAS